MVGADGGWSDVRRFIIASKNTNGDGNGNGKKEGGEVEQRWKPDFAGVDAIYGVSKRIESAVEDGEDTGGEGEQREGDTHWVFVDGGMASTWALEEGKMFWTISLFSKTPPGREKKSPKPQEGEDKLYGANVSLGGYGFEETKTALESYENAWHPTAGNFGKLLRNSERIVRTPLWYRAWEGDEIGGGDVVVIGDAARLMLPTSGQGTYFLL